MDSVRAPSDTSTSPDPEPEFRASLLCWQGDCHMCRMARCWCGCHGPRSTGGER
jgi:hypothetical protein